MHLFRVQGQQRYSIREQIHRCDFPRQREYQRLRAEIFVNQFGWQIPVDSGGCERDRYDTFDHDRVRISCVYGMCSGAEYLLGGVRTLILRNWGESMTMNEFHTAGMVPATVVQALEERYDPTHLLEITRLCLQRCHIYQPQMAGFASAQFQMDIARDLVYASVYGLAEQTSRQWALGITDRYYLRVMRQSKFVFDELYRQKQGARGGYSLILINLPATIEAMLESDANNDRVERMLILCTQSNDRLSKYA